MAKIRALPRIPAGQATGEELLPVVKDGKTMGAPVREIVAPAAQPFVDQAREIAQGMTYTGLTGTAALYASALALAAVNGPAAGQSAVVTGTAREGSFQFDETDLSQWVASDPTGAFYVAPNGAPTGAQGAWKRVLTTRVVLDNAAGIDPTGLTNCAPALQSFLNTCAARFPKGFTVEARQGSRFRLTAAVALPQRCTIRGLDITTTGAFDLFTVQAGISQANALTSFYENIFVEDCTFTADAQGNEKCVVRATNVHRFGLLRNRCFNIGGITVSHGISTSGLSSTVAHTSTHDGIDDTGLSFTNPDTGASIPGDPDVGLNEQIWVQNNIIIASAPYTRAARFEYCRQFFATGNYCKFAHMSWLGGSAPRDEGGWSGAFRRCRHGMFANNYVEGVNGGIYGQKGEHIVVSGNVLKNITDTGIDFEGCINCSAIGNIVENAGNFCLSTFYLSKNILFQGNMCRQDGTGTLINDRLYGGTSKGKISPQNGNIFFAMRVGDSAFWSDNDVKVMSNVFEWRGATGYGAQSVGYCRNFVYEGNHHLNVVATLIDSFRWRAKAKGNRFLWTAATDTAVNILTIGATEALTGECIDNEVEIDGVTLPEGSRAILCRAAVSGNASRMIVRGNRVTRINGGVLPAGGALALQGTPTVGQVSRFYCEDNIVDEITDLSDPGRATIFASGNRTILGVPVPDMASAAQFTYAKHSRLEAASPAPGAPAYKVATADGTVMLAANAFAASKAYAAAASFYTSAGNVYRVTTAGTSGTAEPTGTTTAIATGPDTLVVRYMGKVASWATVAASGATAASSAASGAITPDVSSYGTFARTALSAALAINAPTGTPFDGQTIRFRLKDNGTARALTWNAAYRAIGVVLPVTTTATKTSYVTAIYNAADAVWDVVSVGTQA